MSADVTPTFRQKLGCWLHERWRAEIILRLPRLTRLLGWSWLDLRNRSETLRPDPVSGGRICDWSDSSRLTIAQVFPDFALEVFRGALDEWPIRLEDPAHAVTGREQEVTFLIPIGGMDRTTQFKLALAAARAQTDVGVEIIVIEQSLEPMLRDCLPADVNYVHQSAELVGGFNKSRALNLGARLAKTEKLIVLDADFLVPQRFASECARVLAVIEAARPARWIGYLDSVSTERLAQTDEISSLSSIEQILTNNPTPVAVRRSTYWEIGGHDESYVGWGGEDTEFLDRLRTRDISEGGWMPILHAWHALAPKKAGGDRNRSLHSRKMTDAPDVRISRLVALAESGHLRHRSSTP